MTPAINLHSERKKVPTIHQYEHDPNNASYGLEAAEALTRTENRVQNLLFLNGEEKTCGHDYSCRPKAESNWLQSSKAKKKQILTQTSLRKQPDMVGGISP